MYTKRLIQVPVLLAALLSATSSFAGTNYAGTDCEQEFGGTTDDDWTGAITNTSTQLTYVVCHVPHQDFDGFLHNGAIESGFFTAVDENPAIDVNCRFRSVWQSGTVLNAVWAASGSTSGHGNHIQKVGLGGTDQENEDSVYVLSCTLPPTDPASGHMSLVRGYRVDQ